MATTTARGILLEGDLYMQAIVGGILQPASGPLEGTRFELQPQVERKDMLSRGKFRYGQTIETVGVPQQTTFAITLAEGNADALALGLMGAVEALNQAAATITNEAVTVESGAWVPLSKRNISGSITVTGEVGSFTGSITGTTLNVTAITSGVVSPGQTIAGSGLTAGTKVVRWLTGTEFGVGTYEVSASQTFASGAITATVPASLAEGVDYLVNRSLGWVKALVGGALYDRQAVKVSGSAAIYTGKRIRGAVNTDLRARMVLDGRNLVDGNDVTVTVWEAVLAPDSALDLLNGEFTSTSLSGTLKTPTGYTEPFVMDLANAA